MTKTMRIALLVLNALVSLLELYAKSTPDERDNKVAASLRSALTNVAAIMNGQSMA